MKYKYVWLLILVLFVGDVATTVYGLEQGYGEANPTAEHFMDEYGNLAGMLMLVPVKLFAASLGLFGQWIAPPSDKKWFPMTIFIMAVLPVAWNLYVLS